MPQPIVLSIPHKSTPAAAKAEIDATANRLFERYRTYLSASSIEWRGNHADVVAGALGADLRGEIDIDAESVKMTVHLPLTLLPMRGAITAFLKANAPALAPPKS